jgi:predicted RNase H-like HicB family nuclease
VQAQTLAYRPPPAGRLGGLTMSTRSYLVVIERGERNFSVYVPDLPGCIATGTTREQTVERMREAIALHIEGLRADGEPVPEPVTSAELVAA